MWLFFYCNFSNFLANDYFTYNKITINNMHPNSLPHQSSLTPSPSLELTLQTAYIKFSFITVTLYPKTLPASLDNSSGYLKGIQRALALAAGAPGYRASSL